MSGCVDEKLENPEEKTSTIVPRGEEKELILLFAKKVKNCFNFIRSEPRKKKLFFSDL